MRALRSISRNQRGHNSFGDFVCMNCRNFVSAEAIFSGVQNRNHCPYCLASRHLDLYKAGDRLSACKSIMKPVALTVKRVNKKYGRDYQGEIMLVHQCEGCGKLSINRIAADDNIDSLMSVFENSCALDSLGSSIFLQDEIHPLLAKDRFRITAQLFGQR